MDKTSFTIWFRAMNDKLGLPPIRLRWMTPNEYRLRELGNFNSGANTITIDERVLPNDSEAMNVGLHELAHAIVFQQDADVLTRNEYGQIKYNPMDSRAKSAILELNFAGGHGGNWISIAKHLGVDTTRYVDRHPMTAREQVSAAALGNARLGTNFTLPMVFRKH